jgi:hypothetical protein
MDWKNNMKIKSLSPSTRTALLAKTAHILTICARDTTKSGRKMYWSHRFCDLITNSYIA